MGWEKDNLLIGKFSGFFVVIALAFGKALAVLSWMTLIGIAGAHLAPSDYGQLLLLSNLATLVVILGGFGQPQLLLFRNGQLGSAVRSKIHDTNFKSGVRVLILMTVASAMLIVSLLLVLANFRVWLLIPWCIWAMGSCWQALMAEESKAVSRMWIAGLVGNSAAAGGAVVISGALLIIEAVSRLTPLVINLTFILLALAVASIVCSIWLLLSYLFDRSRYCQPLTETNAVEVQDSSINTWRMGLFGTANGVLIFLIGQSDLWWASTWFGVGAAGSYGTASYLARFCSLLSILLAGTYAAPFAAMLAQGAYHTLSHKIRFLALLSTSAGLLIWLALAAGLQLGFIGKWFHLDAEGSMLALLVLGAGHVIGSFFGFGPVLLASAGKFADLLVIAGASSLLTIILSTLAVLFTGLGGLGAAFGLSYAFFAYICHWQCRRVLGINPFGNIH